MKFGCLTAWMCNTVYHINVNSGVKASKSSLIFLDRYSQKTYLVTQWDDGFVPCGRMTSKIYQTINVIRQADISNDMIVDHRLLHRQYIVSGLQLIEM